MPVFCGMLLSALRKEEGEEKLYILMVDSAGAKLYEAIVCSRRRLPEYLSEPKNNCKRKKSQRRTDGQNNARTYERVISFLYAAGETPNAFRNSRLK